MKIVHADIYGFGKWSQTSLDFSKGSLIVINGENESGKSTLRQFMLFMLFGMQPKKRAQFLPKKGGKLGGRLTIQTEDCGTFTIERLHDRNKALATCYHEDGNQYDESWLQQRLKGLDAQAFSAIFSFDSVTLQQLQQIKKADIGEVLLGIGMTGTDQIYWTEKWLDQQLQQLFKPHGKKPTINQLLETIEEKTNELVRMEQEVESYQQKQQEKTILQDTLSELQEEYEVLRKEKLQTEQKLHLYPTIEAFHQTQQKLASFSTEIEFPEQGLTRYQQIKEAMYPLKSELTLIESNLEKENQQLIQVEESLLNAEVVNSLEELITKAKKHQDIDNKLQFTKKSIEDLEKRLTQELHLMQVGLTIDSFKGFSFSFATEEIWQEIKEEQEQITREFATIENEQATLKEQQNFLAKEKQTYEQNQLDQATINRFVEQVDHKKQVEAEHKLTANRNKQKQSWQSMKQTKIRNANRIGLISFGLILISGIIGFLQSTFYWYGFSIIGLIFILLQQVSLRQSIRSMEPLFVAKTDDSTIKSIDERQFQEAEAILQEQNQLQLQVDKTENALRDLQLEQVKLEERKQFYKQKQQMLTIKITEQIKQYPFLQDVLVSHWPKLYHHLEKAMEKAEKIYILTKEADQLAADIRDFSLALEEAYYQHFSQKEEDKSKMLQAIREIAEGQKYKMEEQTQIRMRSDDLVTKKQAIQSKLQPYQADIKQLWQKAKVNDEEQYITKGNQKQEQQALEKELAVYQQQLVAFLSEQEWSRLSQGDLVTKVEQDEALGMVTAKLKEIQAEIKEKQQQLATIHLELEQLETSTLYVDAKHRYYTLQSELQQHAKQWAVYQLAIEKLQDTKEVFQHYYLPKVLERTTFHFNYITNNKYVNVYVTNQDAILQVEDFEGVHFNVAELSQGARDQLYISLRIALSEMFQKQMRMPFFIDDAFVHFDPNRLEKIIKIFQKMTENQQIILFTNDTTWGKMTPDKKNTQIVQI
ncbi:hypothetical protein GCM10011351_09050 [Paraliobacillus quinghaiensis]|uniref:YhaN AAA domain-containing protein n=1 Tax=Paraliobacillus quinghaiensis TaxID=470815 RepID=A0A917TJK7_9BACI|nr:AAA family ATPase [Paraliobacillus quinghaiensis]GGM25562.1 hypothetical protein GCM10011351_09050 [Paraliobacillus quinghaiensis]